jgi:hypothetical protein
VAGHRHGHALGDSRTDHVPGGGAMVATVK